MSRFFIGLLLGVLVGITGASAFLIVYGGGDYLVSTSPRMRELEAALRSADEDRDWLKGRLRESTEATHRLESRFEALATRFEGLTAAAQSAPAASPTPSEAGAATAQAVNPPGEPASTAEPLAAETGPAEAPGDAAAGGDPTSVGGE